MIETTAAPPAMTTAAEPDGAPRNTGLDIVRGVAILGILFMNINDMGASVYANGYFARHLGWSQADRIAWWCREVFADGTARCLLQLLFGAGMAILTDRAMAAATDDGGRPQRWFLVATRTLFGPLTVLRGYYRRNFILLLFGLAHLFVLLWFGDILHTYAIAAMIAFLFRRLGRRTLVVMGLSIAIAQLIGQGNGLYGAQQAFARAAEARASAAAGRPLTKDDRAAIAAANTLRSDQAAFEARERERLARDDRDRAAATGSFSTWAAASWRVTLSFWGVGPDSYFEEGLFLWEAAATMLLGIALFRWGVMQGNASPRVYWLLLIGGYGLGLTLRVARAAVEMRFAAYPSLWFATVELGRLPMSLGHLAAIWLMLKTTAGTRLLQPFAAAGRSALTLYIVQTLICLWVLFPPFALGLYGKFSWWQLMATAAVIDAVLLVAAVLYMRRHTIAPVEWAWRSIIAGRRLPIRRRSAT